MCDTARMREGQGRRNLLEYALAVRRGKTTGRQAVGERSPIGRGAHQIELPIDHACVQQQLDMRVFEFEERRRSRLEAFGEPGLTAQCRRENGQINIAGTVGIVGFVGCSALVLTHQVNYGKASEALAWLKGW